MNNFIHGDWIQTREVKNDERLKAMHAVCGLMNNDNNKIHAYFRDIIMFMSPDHVLQSMSLNNGKPEQRHTLTEWLFKGAPDWAVELGFCEDEYYWINGKSQFCVVGNIDEVFFGFHYDGKIIATRDDNFTDIKAISHKIRNQSMKVPTWQSLDSFQWKSIECYCWIAYKGKVLHCWYDGAGYFRFNEHSQSIYLSECILAVMPIQEPKLPQKEEVGNEQEKDQAKAT